MMARKAIVTVTPFLLTMMAVGTIACDDSENESNHSSSPTTEMSATDRVGSFPYPQNNGPLLVSTAEEASKIAGYEVITPDFVPEGLDRHSIFVDDKPIGDLPTVVMQMWGKDGKIPAITLIQDPALDGIGGGEPADFAGIKGIKHVSKAVEGRPSPLLTFYWKDGDMTYTLAGMLVEPISEEVLENMVMSIERKSRGE